MNRVQFNQYILFCVKILERLISIKVLSVSLAHASEVIMSLAYWMFVSHRWSVCKTSTCAGRIIATVSFGGCKHSDATCVCLLSKLLPHRHTREWKDWPVDLSEAAVTQRPRWQTTEFLLHDDCLIKATSFHFPESRMSSMCPIKQLKSLCEVSSCSLVQHHVLLTEAAFTPNWVARQIYIQSHCVVVSTSLDARSPRGELCWRTLFLRVCAPCKTVPVA